MSQVAPVSEQKDREVLPRTVTPTHYFVSLTPDLVSQFKFLGKVEIELRVNEECDQILLNAADLTFMAASVEQGGETVKINVGDIQMDTKKEIATFPLGQRLKAKADAKLTIEFVGILNDQMKGFYRSKYTRKDGKESYCGVTQFEATDARRAFPCWDEPAVKSAFTVELTVPNDLVCLSNMPEAEINVSGDVKTVLFERSPVMSVYLLAWFVGEFDFVESKTSRDVRVRVWSPVEKKDQGTFACETACKCLDFYEKYFGILYPLPKCDMIAVPDFAAGAMENWGLITYREVALLADSEKASVRQKRYIAIVVCHELAHQWFGNLVTMDWWSQLWLNEGFACFMEYFSSDAIFPEWPMWNLFVTNEYSRAFTLDGMATSHPIEVDVKTAEEAEEMFDAISYCKGACVIRMLEGYVGEKSFQGGLTNYLNNFRYSNAVTNDLWDFLAKEANKPVGSVMSTWTREQGFPMVTASRAGDKLTLTQVRYLSSGKLSKDQERVTWSIPMKLRVSGSPGEPMSILFTEKKQSFDLPAGTTWVHLNAESVGFYCCEYEPAMIDALADAGDALSTLDKVCLVRDAVALAEAGFKGATHNLLNLLGAFKEDTTYPVWDAVVSAAGNIKHLIDADEEAGRDFDVVMRDVLRPLFEKVGWEAKEPEEDPDIAALLRPLVLGAMSRYGEQAVIDEGLRRFQAFMDDPEKSVQTLDPSIRSVVYGMAVKYGGKEQFDLLRDYYLKAQDPAERSWSLRSLGHTRVPELVDELIRWIWESEDVKRQDKVFPFRVAAGNSAAREQCWQYLQANIDTLYKMFEGGFLVQHLVKIPNQFVTFKKEKEVEKFFGTLNYPKCKRSMQQCLENIHKYAKWRHNELDVVRKWASEQAKRCQ